MMNLSKISLTEIDSVHSIHRAIAYFNKLVPSKIDDEN